MPNFVELRDRINLNHEVAIEICKQLEDAHERMFGYTPPHEPLSDVPEPSTGFVNAAYDRTLATTQLLDRIRALTSSIHGQLLDLNAVPPKLMPTSPIKGAHHGGY